MGRNNKRKSNRKKVMKKSNETNKVNINKGDIKNKKKNDENKFDFIHIKNSVIGFFNRIDLSKIKGAIAKTPLGNKKNRYAIVSAGAIVLFTIPVMMLSQNGKKEETVGLYAKINQEKVDEIVKANEENMVAGFILPQWNIEKAKGAFSLDDVENGMAYLEAAVKSEVIDEEMANEIILIYFMNGQALQSMEVGEELISKYKNSIEINKTMIMVYLFNGVKNKAVELITELRESMDINFTSLEPINEYKGISDRERAQKYADLAEMFYLIGENQETLAYLERAWDYDRDNYKVYDLIAKMASDNMFETLSNISLREVNLQEAASKNKLINYNEKMFKLWLAKIYSLDDKTTLEAEYLIEDLEKDFGELINLQRMKATTLVLNGQVEEGMKLMDTMKTKYPNDFSIRYTSASLYYITQNFDKAFEEAMKVIELKPSYEDTYGLLLPNIYAVLGEDNKIEESFLESIEKNPISVSNINAIAAYYFRNKDYEKSLQYYNIAKVLNPSNAEIRYKSAWANIAIAEKTKIQMGKNKEENLEAEQLFIVENYEKALELVLSSINLTDENPKAKYYRMVSIIYMNLGEAEKSYDYIKKAYRLDEDDILTLNNAGVFHFLLNDYQDDLDNDSRVYRGYYNVYKAYEGLSDDYDAQVIDVITQNYEIAEEFRKKFKEADDDSVMELPKGFKLLY